MYKIRVYQDIDELDGVKLTLKKVFITICKLEGKAP